MNSTITPSIKIVRYLTFTFSFVLSIIASNAHAVFINFDDLTYVPSDLEWPHFSDVPITDQYESQGLVVSDGFLAPYNFFNPDAELGPDDISGPNYLLGSNELYLNFVGEKLPTYVGMYVGSAQEMIFLEVYGASGLLGSASTKGIGPPTWDQPYEPRQYVSFEFAEGIRQIQMWGAYGSRTSAHIDDLTFTYADVPEPSSFLLMCLGAFALAFRRIKN